jgi:nucleotide-binding universal stress UspA family protein
VREENVTNRCILAATDGEPGSIGALRCARDVAERLGLPLEVISVCEPTSTYGYESADLVAGVMREMSEASRNIRRRRVMALLARAGVACRPLVTIEVGSPAAVIGRAAQQREALMIVAGLGSHSTLDRMLADETSLRLMQSARIPILSVPPEYAGLPERALAAIDFTSYSIDAARTTLSLLPAGGELHLVHVAADHGHHGLGTWRHPELGDALRQEARSRLDALADDLSRVAGITVSAHLLEGRPAHAVLRFATALGVDLLAAGTNGYGLVGRLLMGSVATQLVRRSSYLTLVAPPRGFSPGADHTVPDLRRDRASVVREALSAVSGDAL